MTKEVRYDIYCKSCKHWAVSASNDPCNDCLGQPSNGDSHVPVYYEKGGPVVNYIIPDSIQTIHQDDEVKYKVIFDYTRDRLKTEKWADHEPTKEDLKKFFALRDGDYWEVL